MPRYSSRVPGAPPGRRQVKKFGGKDYFLRGSYKRNDAGAQADSAREQGYSARVTGPHREPGVAFQFHRVWLRRKK